MIKDRHKILIVDDEELFAMGLKLILNLKATRLMRHAARRRHCLST